MKYPGACEPEISRLVENVANETLALLRDQVTSIILHGSLAMGAYYFPKSDIDILVVVKSTLAPLKRKQYFKEILSISNRRPSVGDLELSAVLESALSTSKVSIPYEVHFGSELKITHDSFDYSLEREDGDLPAHLMVAYHRGISLFGPELREIMKEPSWESYRKSVTDDLEWILSDENILTTPFYTILNCCRSYLLLVKNENRVLSKEEGALAAMTVFPRSTNALIQRALSAYKSDRRVTESTRRTNGEVWNSEELLLFRDEMRELFSNAKVVLSLTDQKLTSQSRQSNVYLETERMILRELTIQDEQLILELDADPEVMRYLTNGVPSPIEDVRAALLGTEVLLKQHEGRFGFWAAELKETGEFVGWFHFRPAKDDPNNIKRIELGYRLLRCYWSKGLATEGSIALLRKGFLELGVEEVFAVTMEKNLASRKVMEKSGLKFKREFFDPSHLGTTELDVEYSIDKASYGKRASCPK